MKTRSAAEVVGRLQGGKRVRDTAVPESLDLRRLCEEGDQVRLPIRLAGCRLAGLAGACVGFHEPVILEGCTVGPGEGDFFAAYFLAGLQISRCSFPSGVDFQCGGHNQGSRPILIEETTFGAFVIFFDCWFAGPVVIHRCRFEGGTNLLGNRDHPCEVRFDVPPVIEGNEGDLCRDGG